MYYLAQAYAFQSTIYCNGEAKNTPVVLKSMNITAKSQDVLAKSIDVLAKSQDVGAKSQDVLVNNQEFLEKSKAKSGITLSDSSLCKPVL